MDRLPKETSWPAPANGRSSAARRLCQYHYIFTRSHQQKTSTNRTAHAATSSQRRTVCMRKTNALPRQTPNSKNDHHLHPRIAMTTLTTVKTNEATTSLAAAAVKNRPAAATTNRAAMEAWTKKTEPFYAETPVSPATAIVAIRKHIVLPLLVHDQGHSLTLTGGGDNHCITDQVTSATDPTEVDHRTDPGGIFHQVTTDTATTLLPLHHHIPPPPLRTQAPTPDLPALRARPHGATIDVIGTADDITDLATLTSHGQAESPHLCHVHHHHPTESSEEFGRVSISILTIFFPSQTT